MTPPPKKEKKKDEVDECWVNVGRRDLESTSRHPSFGYASPQFENDTIQEYCHSIRERCLALKTT